MKFFDSHSHLNFPKYNEDRENVILRMKEAGVGTICVGTDVRTSQESIELARKNENVWASVGIHPTNPNANTSFEGITELVSEPKVVAIGECGLDFFRIAEKQLQDEQKNVFLFHLELAQNNNLPLIIHCRNAYDELIEIFRQQGVVKVSGVTHFFAGSVEQAQAFMDLGLCISFAGPITFTDEYDRVLEAVSLDRILIETDAPFAAPTPYRGKRNEPSYVVEVAKKIALVKDVSVDEVAERTLNNAITLFNLDVRN